MVLGATVIATFHENLFPVAPGSNANMSGVFTEIPTDLPDFSLPLMLWVEQSWRRQLRRGIGNY